MHKKLTALLVVLALAVTGLSGCSRETVDYRTHLTDYVKTMEYHDGFTILQLTDIHWNGSTQIGDESYGSERYLKKVIDEAVAHAGRIDLIEVTGDTFMLSNSEAVNSFIDFMEEVGIPYAMVWGNHDREGKYNPNWISERFLEAPYSLYTEVDNDNVHERCNYVINLLKEDGTTAWQITNIDSGASYREGAKDLKLTYDYIRDDQYEWMSAEHELVGSNVPVICYYHIPQLDSKLAYEAIVNGADYKHKFFKHEGFGNSRFANTAEETFVANNVKAAFMGHAHSADWTYTSPAGIIYGLGVKTGEELYITDVKVNDPADAAPADAPGFDFDEDFELLGASLVTLNDTEGNLTLEHLYLNERDGGDFRLWVEY